VKAVIVVRKKKRRIPSHRPIQGVVGLIRACPSQCGIAVLVVILGMLAVSSPWPELTTATPLNRSTSTAEPELSSATQRESSSKAEPESSNPEKLQQDLDATQERISALESQLLELADARQNRATLIEIREKHSSGFGRFNFSEGRKAVSEILVVMEIMEKYPLEEGEKLLLKQSRSAADSPFGAPNNVYDSMRQLADNLCERRRRMKQRLQHLQNVEQELIGKLRQ